MIVIPQSLSTIKQFNSDSERKLFASVAAEKNIVPLNYTIRNEGEDVTEIDIEGVIGEDWWAMSEEEFRKNTKENIKDVLRGISSSEIIVNINSYGGDVNHGLSIHDLLVDHEASITTRINGMTASAATIISQAGDKRLMSKNATFLAHRAWTIAMGNKNNMDLVAQDLDTLDVLIASVYEGTGNRSADDYLAIMNEANGDGRWRTADEAKEDGFIDEIYNKKEDNDSDSASKNFTNNKQTNPPDSANDARIRNRIKITQLKAKAL